MARTSGVAGPVAAPALPTPVPVDARDLADTLERLRQAHAELDLVIGMVQQGRDCSEIVPRIAATSKALDRVGFEVIAASLRQCLVRDPSGEHVEAASLEKLFLYLA